MSRRRQIYEGKAKVLFEGPEPGTLVQHFKDDASAFNNQKRGIITGKGVLNNRISEFLMLKLAEIGVPTHLVRRLNMREQLVREVEMIPVAVVVRNVAAGSLSQRLGDCRGHVAAALDRRIPLQEGRARRPARLGRAHHRLWLGRHPRPRRDGADRVAGERLPDRGCSSASASGWSISSSNSAGSIPMTTCAS
jgi:SAICAR synthetase